ncbi:hypothetical protein Sango_0948100 [Sesamum angolense]|uniref:Uncharacterized protein n=1 Tax=Sesamum angolense TaxID=2727404 RepID=A0AAE1WZR5_9LAMI|nr:hypothetical protein Sango_0948100 [Sesamum angolense]
MTLSKSPFMETRDCHVCNSMDPVTLHNIPHRGAFALLCTACVLRHNPGSFCPLCFDVYDDTANNKRPAAHSHIVCLRCPAVVHAACLPSTRSFPSFRYLCPQCSLPSSSFFDFGRSNGGSTTVFTRDLAKQLLCAAKIASVAMHQAAAVARTVAEQKVKEALLARQRAKEAIERVAHLMADQQREDESDVDDGSSGE